MSVNETDHALIIQHVSNWLISGIVIVDAPGFFCTNDKLHIITSEPILINHLVDMAAGFNNVYVNRTKHMTIISRIVNTGCKYTKKQDYVEINIKSAESITIRSNKWYLWIWLICISMFVFVLYFHIILSTRLLTY
jgi:hypothetical protein